MAPNRPMRSFALLLKSIQKLNMGNTGSFLLSSGIQKTQIPPFSCFVRASLIGVCSPYTLIGHLLICICLCIPSPLNSTDYCGSCFIKIVRRKTEGRGRGGDAAATDPNIVFFFVFVFVFPFCIFFCIKIARRKAEERGGASCWPKFPTSLPSLHPSNTLPPLPSLPIAEWWISGGIFYGMPPKSNPLPLAPSSLPASPHYIPVQSHLDFLLPGQNKITDRRMRKHPLALIFS